MGGCRRGASTPRGCTSVWPPSRREAALAGRLLPLPTSVSGLAPSRFLSPSPYAGGVFMVREEEHWGFESKDTSPDLVFPITAGQPGPAP